MRRSTLLLVLGVLVVVLAVVPWGDFQSHPQWSRVGWIPFVSRPIRTSDIVANVLLFMPFGAGVVLVMGRRRPALVYATAGGALLSLTGEALQLYSHTRFPSATDVVCNTAGAALAAFLTLQRSPRPGNRDRH